jgi:hypothetical protein
MINGGTAFLEVERFGSSFPPPPERDSSVGWFFRSLHPIQDLKKESKNIFMLLMLIFTELGQDLTNLAHKENTLRDIFLWDRRKL